LDSHALRILREVGLGVRRALVVIVASVVDLPSDIERESAALELALPTRDELAAILPPPSDAARDWAKDWDRAAFARAAAGLTMAEARRAFELARLEADPAQAVGRVIAQKRRALRKSATLELADDDVPLDDLGGLHVLKAWLTSRVRAYSDEARSFGLAEPRGMLLCGVQCCGKSHASKAAASLPGLPLVRLDFAAVFASPSPEHALHEGLRAVTAIAPVVLWVDEIEKGLGGGASIDAQQVRVFGAFLTWLQEHTA